jgi:heterotetrameric sarcosine oxidase gamma subunit
MFGVSATVLEFPASSTTLTERSDIGCISLNCAIEMDAAVARLEEVIGMALPRAAGATAHIEHKTALWLTPRSWLIQCRVDHEFQLAALINTAFEDKSIHAALFTDYLCWMELRGPRAWELLADGGFISLELDGLPSGNAKRTLLAGIPVIIVRDSSDGWTIGIERSRARYFVDWLREAAAACELQPIERG